MKRINTVADVRKLVYGDRRARKATAAPRTRRTSARRRQPTRCALCAGTGAVEANPLNEIGTTQFIPCPECSQ